MSKSVLARRQADDRGWTEKYFYLSGYRTDYKDEAEDNQRT